MTYRELIQNLEKNFAEHLDDELCIQEPYDEPEVFNYVAPVIFEDELRLCL